VFEGLWQQHPKIVTAPPLHPNGAVALELPIQKFAQLLKQKSAAVPVHTIIIKTTNA
jgi:hypothetical protein